MIKIYKKRKGRKRTRPSEVEFNFKYYTLDMSGEELAKEYGVTPNTIYQWAHRFRKEEESQKKE